MNIVFITMSRISSIRQRGIYTDLMRKFRDEGHGVYIVSPYERAFRKPTSLSKTDGVWLLGVRTLNLQQTNIIEKGVGQLLVEKQYKEAIRKYFKDVQFDLILYSTPPITLTKVISFLKSQNKRAKTYLLLKDIFPQNALDIGLLSKTGVKGFLYHHFRCKEKELYGLSDFIGCMSPANLEYILAHNPEIPSDKVEVAPNSIELRTVGEIPIDKLVIKAKYGLPDDKPIFIYGGNLGRPQGIPFLIECLEANANRDDCFFVIVGSGTELPQLKEWSQKKRAKSVKVMEGLPRDEYERFVKACDVGMIFLDYRFTIPNFPSRLLNYLENKMPIICATDPNTDIGQIAEENGYGFWCESNSVNRFTEMLNKMLHSNRSLMGEKGYVFLKENYLVEKTYNSIISHV